MRRCWLATICAALCLGGCGFHLRGWDLGQHIESVHVAAGGASFLAAPLREALEAAKVETERGLTASEVTINLLDQRTDRRSAAVGSGVRTAELETTLAVQFSIDRAGAGQLSVPRWIEGTRILSIDRSSIVGSAEEQVLLEKEITNDLVQQILRSLNIALQAPAEAQGAG